MEIWKDIPEYEGLYQASNLGRIRSLYKSSEGVVLRPRNTKRYYMIALYKNKKRKDILIHKIVAQIFVENKENKPFVNHKDENTFNNNSNNLMWCTHQENMNWGTRNKRISLKNTDNPKRCKRIIQYDKFGNYIREYASIKDACKQLNIKPCHIGECCENKYGRKTAYGYIWKYAIDK